ncbi:signal peptidase I [Sphingobacterium sp. DN00404]|uniref:Signal peptidase I n=1 Tax=Sphingobacterium micropteri TaxID=2763501 RepID=A0ABR7YNS0_9SPHI|nr:signal peptidase I [Sphingobacterium micropteri]MBD1432876.1 signal peptidase I [Sphingobacterium micropteri]
MKRTKSNKRDIWRMVLIGIITVIVVITLRILVFASFKIPSFSMEPTLFAGDFILVNKLIPGPRIDFLGNNEEGRPLRLIGYRTIKRNEVLVFNDPYYKSAEIIQNWNAYYVKRCVGMPGDTLYIAGGIYYSNGQRNKINDKIATDSAQYAAMLPKFRIPGRFKELGWTIDNFGPIYIPAQGDLVTLDTINIHLYRPLIEYETGKKLVEMEDVYLLNGEVCRQYQFKLDYYFMAGDRGTDSKDSRYWGLLPKDHIVGKVAYIWKSKDSGTDKYRWDRFFKSVE